MDDDSAFEPAADGKKKSLRVYVINPPTGDNPWRTLGDYNEEQREARERHAMFQEQHRLLQRSFLASKIAVAAAVVAALATCVIAYLTHLSINKPQSTNTVILQSPQEPISTMNKEK